MGVESEVWGFANFAALQEVVLGLDAKMFHLRQNPTTPLFVVFSSPYGVATAMDALHIDLHYQIKVLLTKNDDGCVLKKNGVVDVT
jgi:hypothetical protein